jgi:SAM-dependent methyltransferase
MSEPMQTGSETAVTEMPAPVTPTRGPSGRATTALGAAAAGLAAAGINGMAFGLGALVGAKIGLRAGVWWQPRPMPHQTARFLDHPWRMIYRRPEPLLRLLGLFNGMTVADVGCGTGLFTVEMARLVGARGLVHAIDCQTPMLTHTQGRVAAAGLSERVRLHRAGIHQLPLPDDSLDLALMVAVIGELPAREAALEEARRVLKPGGRLVISEELPDPAYMPSLLVQRWAETVGFRPGGYAGTPFCYSLILLNDK